MARRRLEGLERVLGVNALFSTAYGNVGSSIYYALGLVASYALGLTPIVFIITGFFFFCTAASYAEATAMFPEAGGSSSFARRAFNEFWSFFAAWAGMLTYTVTIAISAFFVPHYIGGVFDFADSLRESPGDIIAAVVVISLLAAINVFGAKESTGINVTLAVVDFLTQLLLVVIGAVLVFSPETLVGQRPPRRRARRGTTSSSPSRSACSPTRASRPSPTWPRRPRTRSTRSRRRSTACGSRCSRSTSRCRRSRSRRCRSRRSTASTRPSSG